MKKAVLFVIVFVACLFLHACGGNPESAPTKSEPPTISSTSGASADCSHDYKIINTSEATCTKFGSIVYQCSVCSHQYQMEQPKLPHSFTQATCAAPKTCTQCGITEGDTLVHQPGEWSTVVDATPVTPGRQQQKCKVCGTVINEQEIPATGSVGLAYSVNEDGATCTITGIGRCTDVEIYIPEYIDGYKVTAIGPMAFQRGRMTYISIPDSVTIIGDYAFSYCSSLASITIPDSVTIIDVYAFYVCSSLTRITIPDSVTSIGDSAFSWCSSLTSVTIGNGVTSIGNFAFYGCSSLTGFLVDEENPNYCSDEHGILFNKEKSNLIAVPGAISGAYRIPNGVTQIGDGAFAGCSILTSITILEGVTSIRAYAFYGCSSLTSITIPDSVTSIGYAAFEGCSSLTSVTIGNGVTSIGDGAFYACSSLTSITIPDSVTSIGDSAFSGCSSLTSITIPDSVTSIGGSAFYGCFRLTSVTIGNGVTSIGSDAFYNCSLTEIHFGGTKEQWQAISKGSWWNSNDNYTIYCTDGEIKR